MIFIFYPFFFVNMIGHDYYLKYGPTWLAYPFDALCGIIWLHDYLWGLYWWLVSIVWTYALWPAIYWVLLFIPGWVIWAIHYVIGLALVPVDNFCIDIMDWIEQNILDPIIDSKPVPGYWSYSYFEFALDLPIMLWYDKLMYWLSLITHINFN